ncbi:MULTISPECIES: hypothetical protein [unclassified Spirillospora]|uniref:hypothetical protein n=1 Tax=unclassified Spirillospora TaxID=2642701 RepID=UPI00371D451D
MTSLHCCFIEVLHHVRDVTFGEDANKIRTGLGPANMTILRYLIHGRLHEAGTTMISVPSMTR